MRLTTDKKINFESRDGKVYGPFDFVAGRIVELGSDHYTLIDIRKIDAPERREARPDTAPAPAAQPPLEVPPGPPPARPAEPAAVSREPARRPPTREAWGSIGAQVSAVDMTRYDAEIGGVISKSETTIERRGISAIFAQGPFRIQAGATMNGEWSESASESAFGFENAELSDGEGWWAAARYAYDLYSDNEWRVRIYGEGLYRNEDFSLEYDRLVSTLEYVPGTNGTGNLQQVLGFRANATDATVSELAVMLGAGIVYESARWWCYGNLEVVALSEIDVDGGIDVGAETFDIELERSMPVAAEGGIGWKTGSYRLYLEGRAGGDMRVSLGVARMLW